MHLKQLKSFLVAYEEGSFGKAALRCNSTQPGLSTQIATLEAELNVKLFHRHARGITPTAAGRQLYLSGRRLLEDANDVVQEIQALAGAVTGTLSAGISPALGRAILARVLSRYVVDFPEVEVRVSEAYSSTLIALIENRMLDFALVAHIPNQPALKFEHVYSDRFVAVSSPRTGVPAKGPIRLDKPPYYKLAVPSVHHGVQSALDVPLRTGRIVPAQLIEVNSAAAVIEFAMDSDWLALVPYTTVHYQQDSKRFQVHAIAGDELWMDYYVAHLGAEPLSAAAGAFISLAKTELLAIKQTTTAVGGGPSRSLISRGAAKKPDPAKVRRSKTQR